MRSWLAAASQGVGYLGMFACFAAWLLLNRFEPLMFGGFGTLAAAGQGLALRTRRPPEE